jgi:hypothetical protein
MTVARRCRPFQCARSAGRDTQPVRHRRRIASRLRPQRMAPADDHSPAERLPTAAPSSHIDALLGAPMGRSAVRPVCLARVKRRFGLLIGRITHLAGFGGLSAQLSPGGGLVPHGALRPDGPLVSRPPLLAPAAQLLAPAARRPGATRQYGKVAGQWVRPRRRVVSAVLMTPNALGSAARPPPLVARRSLLSRTPQPVGPRPTRAVSERRPRPSHRCRLCLIRGPVVEAPSADAVGRKLPSRRPRTCHRSVRSR